jgi:tRNA nucleotidyltransferase (CCA-adding enzyme)
MRLVVTHEQPDFDALASVALATVLYPGAVGALIGQLDPAVDELLRLYRDHVPLVDAERVDLDDVTGLVIVDTADRTRLGRFGVLVGRLPITVFDHHPEPTDPVPGVQGISEDVGATVTLLSRRLEAEGVRLPPPLATLALLGLHEDTGDLTFDHVSPDDHRAAAWLLTQGANLDMVRRFRSGGTPPHLQAARDRLLAEADLHEVAGRRIAVGRLPGDAYAHGASSVAGDLLAATAADAAFVIARMDGKTLVFARADARVDVGAALQRALGGGGHARAAFARTSLDARSAFERLMTELPACIVPPVRARDIMSSPVVTVRDSARVAEARQELARHKHNGMPVVDAGGRLVGVISRRDIEHALRHDLGDAAVSGFMTRPALTATPDATLGELEGIVLEHDVGRVPIVVGEALVGIVTRTDLVRARHPRPQRRAPADRVWTSLPEGAREVLDTAIALARGARLYLVGGTVRDGLLGVGYVDLDLLVEGMGAADLGAGLQARLGGSLAVHPTFGTATVGLPTGLTIDVAGARAEAYAYPGALPVVREGDLAADLSRRDFTVNALAVRVHPEPHDLIDPFGGLADLEARRLRVLHPLSFVEDPTRLVRGARLAGRLGLRFDGDAVAKAQAALRPSVVGNVSGQRLRAELELTLAEARVTPALRQLDALGALRGLYGLHLDEAACARLDEARVEETRLGLEPTREDGARGGDQGGDHAAAVRLPYLLVLLAATPPGPAAEAIERFHWPKRVAMLRSKLRAAMALEPPLTDATLTALEPAGRRALAALSPSHAAGVAAFEHAPPEPKLRGRDVLSLGLAPGPRVGHVLARIDEERAAGRVRGFAQELELARRLVHEARTDHVGGDPEAGPAPPDPTP